MQRTSCFVVLLLVALLPAGCGEDKDAPYLAFEGGGFIFNYRHATVRYGFNVRPLRRLERGMAIEARMENPAGGTPFLLRQTVLGDVLRYSFHSPELTGVVKGKDYKVEVTMLDKDLKTVLGRYEHSYRSEIDQSVNPEKPPFVGPVFTPNPELDPNAPKKP